MRIDESTRDEMDVHLDGSAAIEKARALLPTFRTVMFVTKTVDGNRLHMRPLATLGDLSVFGGTLWFLTDNRSAKVMEIEREPSVSLAFQNDAESNYLQLDGTANIVNDRAKIRELFSPLMMAWFPDGADDPNITLVRFDATGGAFWENPGGKLQQLASFAKAVVTKTPGKTGRAGTMSLPSHE
jgi:general stress protein 26